MRKVFTASTTEQILTHYSTSSLSPHHKVYFINPLNAELNPIRHLLALVVARHIAHVSWVSVNRQDNAGSFHRLNHWTILSYFNVVHLLAEFKILTFSASIKALKFQHEKVTFPVTSYDSYDSAGPLLYLAVHGWCAEWQLHAAWMPRILKRSWKACRYDKRSQ